MGQREKRSAGFVDQAAQTICAAETLHGAHQVKFLDGRNNHYGNAPAVAEILALATPLR